MEMKLLKKSTVVTSSANRNDNYDDNSKSC